MMGSLAQPQPSQRREPPVTQKFWGTKAKKTREMDPGERCCICQGLVVKEHVAPDEMTGHWREGSIVGAEAGKVCKCHAMQGVGPG